ncbi:hypothetical protein IG631_07144 [Alternaria alternata]|nr:hypothetical protein IG631_07144 [Alternaria alternata]
MLLPDRPFPNSNQLLRSKHTRSKGYQELFPVKPAASGTEYSISEPSALLQAKCSGGCISPIYVAGFPDGDVIQLPKSSSRTRRARILVFTLFVRESSDLSAQQWRHVVRR